MSSGNPHEELIRAVAKKMRAQGLSEIAIRTFEANYRRSLHDDDKQWIRETDIAPIKAAELTHFRDVEREKAADASLLSKTAVLKLNGGLGTTMGLDGAKSLLEVKDGLTFLDIIVRQILLLRRQHGARIRLILMNSFNTSSDTTAFLKKNYPEVSAEPDIELLQNRIPRIHEKDRLPVEHQADRQLEWCPPGHGDIYVCLQHSGLLDRLIGAGVRFLFVSNADNLGATLDARLLQHFAVSDAPFLMEVCERTRDDQKGGHLARSKSGGLILRESVQCHEEDRKHFQDITRHRYFNTNNLWIKLDRLKALIEAHSGIIPLPVIRNVKPVDPKKSDSARVIQFETAMGAVIEVFEDASAVVVPRTRFAPVKTNEDLQRVRSGSYELTDEFTLVAKRP